MSPQPRTFENYALALKVAHDEEIGGRAYFTGMADQFTGHPRRMLLLIAEIERVTEGILAPALARSGQTAGDHDTLVAEGAAEARATVCDWRDLCDRMADEYPTYVAEMAAMLPLAPPRDRPAIEALVAHEQAIVDFARAERAGDATSQRFLVDFLARYSVDHASA